LAQYEHLPISNCISPQEKQEYNLSNRKGA
jgi:hypothetical protein